MKEHQDFMKIALQEAKKAYDSNEVPVGAIVVKNGQIISRTHNQVEKKKQINAHAEILAIEEASMHIDMKYLTGCTLYVTLEPCVMCAGALVWSKIDRIVIGALDAKVGACGSAYQLVQDKMANHQIEVINGILEDECEQLLKTFFKTIRS